MKKHLKLFVLAISLVLVFTIYWIYKENNSDIYYVALGDSLVEGMDPYGVIGYSYSDYIRDYLKENNRLKFYTKEFSKTGYTTNDLKNDIENNKSIKLKDRNLSIKEALRESDLVTITIGANDFLRGLSINDLYTSLDDLQESKRKIDVIGKDVKDVIKVVKKYAKKQIILVGYYNPLPRLTTIKGDVDELIKYSYSVYEDICKDEDIECVNVFDVFDKNEELLPNPLDIHPSIEGYEKISKEVIKKID